MVYRKPGARASWKVRSLIPGVLIVALSSLILGSAAKPAVFAKSSGAGPSLTFTGDVGSPNTKGFGPVRQNTGSDAIVNSLLFDNLVRVAPNEKTIIPDLATRWTVSKDARVFTFFLRKGVNWSDGQPFTAQDVVFTITQAAQFGGTAYIGYQPSEWFQVNGATAIAGTTKSLPGVKAVGDNEVQITLAKPNSLFVRNLTDAVYSILPEHILSSATAKNIATLPFTTSNPVGTGPYLLTKVVPNQYYEFNANPNYFGSKPKIPTLFFKIQVSDASAIAQIKSGELQLAMNLDPRDTSTVEQISGVASKFVVSPASQYLEWRTDNPILSNVLVRQAIFYALDRRTYLHALANDAGQVLWTMTGFDQTQKALNRYPYDLAKAKQLLAQANFDFTAPFVILYCPACDPVWPQLAPAMQADLKKVGINARLDPVSTAAYIAALTNSKPSYAITLNSGGSQGLSPDRSAGFFNCKQPVESFYKNCKLDNLYVKARGTADTIARTKIYNQIGLLLNQQLPLPALWQISGLHAWSTKLGGTFAVYSNARDSLFGITGWTLKP